MRAEFSVKTRRVVAQRAGYRCSIPKCGKLTTGPALEDLNKSVTTGVAAHIYSAALSGRGPRGSGGLSKNELKSLSNAIWLCADHATRIDKDGGSDFSPDILHSYKSLHETRIAHEMSGIHTPFGWVRKFVVSSSPLFSNAFEIEFAKLNLVVGGNSVGKTALCQWIAGTSNPKYLERWEKLYPSSLSPLSIKVEYFNPSQHCVQVDLEHNQYPKFKLNGERMCVSTNSVRVIFPESIEPPYRDIPYHIDVITNSIKLHPYEIQSLFDGLCRESEKFKGVKFEHRDEGSDMSVQVQTESGIRLIPLQLLASSERERLMMELGMIAANNLSTVGPSILILDANHWQINTKWLERYAELLGSPKCRFQTIVTTRLKDIEFEKLTWRGWKKISIDGTPPEANVSTGFGKFR